MISFDVLIVGGGGAGMRAAMEAVRNNNLSVGLISKTSPLRSTTGCTGGGINAVLNTTDAADSFAKHAYDTILGGSFLGDQDAIEFFVEYAPAAIIELAGWGTPFFRDRKGQIAQRRGSGASSSRSCLTLGHAIAHTLYEQLLRSHVTELSHCHVLELIVENNRVHGVVAYHSIAGEIIPILAKAVVIATGGYGRVYSRTTTPLGCTGDGIAVCLNAGIPFKDPEFVQFHPCALAQSGVLISDGARSEGGYLLNNQNKRFMNSYAPQQMEHATRDLVSLAIEREIAEGRGFGSGIDAYVLLDLRHLSQTLFQTRLSQVYRTAKTYALLDAAKDPLSIRPSCHFTMGGIDITDYRTCTTIVPGVFAAGECACVSIHGANRLGGNALSEAVVLGKVAGSAAAAFAESTILPATSPVEEATRRWEETFQNALKKTSSISISKIRSLMAATMWNKVGIMRDEAEMRQALSEIDSLYDQYCITGFSDTERVANISFIHYAETGNMLTIARAVILGALERRESRGSHIRSDYCHKDDAAFLKHTIVRKINNRFEISYRPVTITKYLSKGDESNF